MDGYGTQKPPHRRERPRLRAVPATPEELRRFLEDTKGYRIEDRPRRSTRPRGAVGYQLHVELDGLVPRLWRRIAVPSNLTLGELHPLLQATMGWDDTHLHEWRGVDRRALLADAPENRETFAMRANCEDVFTADEFDRCEDEVSLDDVLVVPGDTLIYRYDIGDDWTHTVELEAVFDDASPVSAVCLAGARACPPEDCGGVPGYRQLLASHTDSDHDEARTRTGPDFAPERFDLAAVNVDLARRSALVWHPPVLDSHFAALLTRIPYRDAPQLYSMIPRADLQGGVGVSDEFRRSWVFPRLRWLVRRTGPSGITLTDTGHLPLSDVAAAHDELDWRGEWREPRSAKVENPQIAALLAAGRALGLTRKHRGRLVLTKIGRSAFHGHLDYWVHVVTAMPLGAGRTEQEAGRILLLALATGATEHERGATMAEASAALGWRGRDGLPCTGDAAFALAGPTLRFLAAMGALVSDERRRTAAKEYEWARAFARMALSM